MAPRDRTQEVREEPGSIGVLAGHWNVKGLLKKSRCLKLRNLILLAHWNHSFDTYLSYLGPVSWFLILSLHGVYHWWGGGGEAAWCCCCTGWGLDSYLSPFWVHSRFTVQGGCSGLRTSASFDYWCGRQHFFIVEGCSQTEIMKPWCLNRHRRPRLFLSSPSSVWSIIGAGTPAITSVLQAAGREEWPQEYILAYVSLL